jgi:hypothetical protein
MRKSGDRTERRDAGEKPTLPPRPSKKKTDDLASFDDAKKALFNKLWQKVPKKFRLALAGLIVIGIGLGATRSTWYPALAAWVHPPAERFAVGGRVLVEKEKGVANADVQLLNQKQDVVSNATTDGEGYVTFNISTENKIVTLRCRNHDGIWTTFFFKPSIKAGGKSFRVFLDEKRMEYDEL